ncbi:MAG: CBS domain-containing protein [Pirellulaceae bacterium]|jgi:CBS domain-containing protein
MTPNDSNSDWPQNLLGSCLRRFRRDDRGSTVVEYAILIALVLAVVLFSAHMVGFVTESTFSEITGNTDKVAEVGQEHGFSTGHFDEKPATLPLAAYEYLRAQDPRVARLVGFFLILPLASLLSFIRFRRYVNKKITEMEALQTQREREIKANKHLIFAKRQEIYTTLTNNIDLLFNNRLRVKNLMSHHSQSVAVDATISEAADLMRCKSVRNLMVCDEHGHLVGLIGFEACMLTDARLVRDAMTTSPVTVTPDAMLNPVTTLMVERKLSAIPVVDNGELVGIITNSDVIVAFQASMHIIQKYFLDNDIQPPEQNHATLISELAPAD